MDVNKGFQFDLYNQLSPFPHRIYLRGVPDDVRQFDREGFKPYQELVSNAETLFLRSLGSKEFSLKFVTAKVSNKDYPEINELISAEGIRLHVFKTKKPNK